MIFCEVPNYSFELNVCLSDKKTSFYFVFFFIFIIFFSFFFFNIFFILSCSFVTCFTLKICHIYIYSIHKRVCISYLNIRKILSVKHFDSVCLVFFFIYFFFVSVRLKKHFIKNQYHKEFKKQPKNLHPNTFLN